MSISSDPGLLESYRRQLAHMKEIGQPLELVYLMWRDQEGITADDLIDELKAASKD